MQTAVFITNNSAINAHRNRPDFSEVEEEVSFESLLATASERGGDCVEDTASELLRFDLPLPMGMVIEVCDEEDGEEEEVEVYAQSRVRVGEVLDGGSAVTGGVKAGDIVRAVTAVQMKMDQPLWQLVGGGIGRPKAVRFMYTTDGKPFEEVMGAIQSNNQDAGGRPAVVVIERAIPSAVA